MYAMLFRRILPNESVHNIKYGRVKLKAAAATQPIYVGRAGRDTEYHFLGGFRSEPVPRRGETREDTSAKCVDLLEDEIRCTLKDRPCDPEKNRGVCGNIPKGHHSENELHIH